MFHVITLNGSNIAALGATSGAIGRVDGGSGIDTLRLLEGASLNLTAIANAGAATPGGFSRLESLEVVDLLTDTAANALTLAVRDIVDMSGLNVFNDATVSPEQGTSLGARVARHQLWVYGGSNDTLTVSDGRWARVGDLVNNGGQRFRVYHGVDAAAQLIVSAEMSPAITTAMGTAMNGSSPTSSAM